MGLCITVIGFREAQVQILLLQAGFGSAKVISRHPHFCNHRRNLSLPPDGDPVQECLTIPVNSTPGLRPTALLLLPPLLQSQGWKHLFTGLPCRCGQHIHSRSGNWVSNSIPAGAAHLHARCFSHCMDICSSSCLLEPASPGTGLLGTHTTGLCGRRSSGGSGESQPMKTRLQWWFSTSLCSYAPSSYTGGKAPTAAGTVLGQSERPQWASLLFSQPMRFWPCSDTGRTGSCSGALSQLGRAPKGHLYLSSTSGLDRKRLPFYRGEVFCGTNLIWCCSKFRFSSQGQWRRAAGMTQKQEGRRHPLTVQPTTWSSSSVSLSSPFLILFLSCTHKEVNIWFKIKQSNLKHTLCRQTSVHCKQSIKLKRSICTCYQLLHFF